MAIKQTWTSDIADLERDYGKVQRENTKLIEQNRKLAKESKRSADARRGQSQAAQKDATSATQSIMKMAASYLGVSKAIQLVTQSLKDKEETERKSREATLSVADAQIKALRNLGAVSAEQRKDFIGQMQDLSRETGVGLQPLYLAASMGLSASGGNIRATLDALQAAAEIAPESAEELTAIAGALLHLGKATRTSNARENLGFLLGVGQQAAVTSTEKIARNLAPGIIGVSGFGGTAQEAGAVIAALTQGMADPEGRKASTAAIKMAKQLEEALPEKDVYKEQIQATGDLAKQLEKFLPTRDVYKVQIDRQTGEIRRALVAEGTGLKTTAQRLRYLEEHEDARRRFLAENPEVRRELVTQGTGLTTTMQRIRYLQENEEARRRFLAGASFEAQAQIPIEQLLGARERGTETMEAMNQALQAIPQPAESAAIATELIRGIQEPHAQRVAAAERARQQMRETMQVSTRAGRLEDIEATYSRQEMAEDLSAAGVPLIRRWMAMPAYYLGTYQADTQQAGYERAVAPVQRELRGEITPESAMLRGYGVTAPFGMLLQLLGVLSTPQSTERAQLLERNVDETFRQTHQMREAIDAERTERPMAPEDVPMRRAAQGDSYQARLDDWYRELDASVAQATSEPSLGQVVDAIHEQTNVIREGQGRAPAAAALAGNIDQHGE